MRFIPYKLQYLWACLRNSRDLSSAVRFIARRDLSVGFIARLRYVAQIYAISARVDCPHTQDEVLSVATAVLRVPSSVDGVIVEAGCFKGGSTAKFSLLAKLTNRRLIAFDSFEGLPDNDESDQVSMFGEIPNFSRGKYCGSLDEVRANVGRHGDLDRCTLVKGWFDQTMPSFADPIVGAYIDVDLASSTKTCLKYLLPLMHPGGSLFSQDGHLPLIQAVLDDDAFWEQDLGRRKPPIEGLYSQKLVRIVA